MTLSLRLFIVTIISLLFALDQVHSAKCTKSQASSCLDDLSVDIEAKIPDELCQGILPRINKCLDNLGNLCQMDKVVKVHIKNIRSQLDQIVGVCPESNPVQTYAGCPRRDAENCLKPLEVQKAVLHSEICLTMTTAVTCLRKVHATCGQSDVRIKYLIETQIQNLDVEGHNKYCDIEESGSGDHLQPTMTVTIAILLLTFCV